MKHQLKEFGYQTGKTERNLYESFGFQNIQQYKQPEAITIGSAAQRAKPWMD